MPDDLRDDPWLRCPECPDGRLKEGAKHIDPSKPAWRRFDCGHFVDDRARQNRAVRVLYREGDGSVHDGWNITNLIDPEQRAKLNEACAKAFGMPPPVDLVEMSDLDALDSEGARDDR